MKDYAMNDRQRLISSAEEKEGRTHFRRLVERGLSEHDASQMSGYHPLQEWDNILGIIGIWALVAVAVAALMVLSDTAFASMSLPEMTRLEAMVAGCLNGGEIRFDDGSRFACVPLMREGK